MTVYKNISGKSNVRDFEIGDDYIIVTFSNNRHYKYTYKVTGEESVEKMKRLAIAGEGLGAMLATKPYHPHEKMW